MSERTLYQEATVGGIQMSVVPVEPDQDSAIIALLSPATVKAIGVSMSYNQAKKVVRVVLVGAGIGDNDD